MPENGVCTFLLTPKCSTSVPQFSVDLLWASGIKERTSRLRSNLQALVGTSAFGQHKVCLGFC